ncbi:hypothetical protein llap_21712 [Limosa lapponica baueri]|uniref:Uncharacterized protein n=1 Tax=Limosa lapponica baueri TaxID=1758121 RepID=A0A2I0T2H0_LIMLA|nr:hypothetical protein llap_21712 [Limosa lapponica baueri]
MELWDAHQLKLSQQESELQKKLDECRRKQDNLMQNLQGEIDFAFQDQALVEASEAEHLVEQQAKSTMQENEGQQEGDSHQREKEESNTAENEKIFAQETEETEYGGSIPHESEETERAGQEVSFTQVSEQENKLEGEGSLAQNNNA